MIEQNVVFGQLTVSAIFLVLISVFLNHRLANSREKIRDRFAQGIELVTAFQPELDAILQTNDDCMIIMTDAAFEKHDSAVRMFVHHLSWVDKFRLKILWHRLAYVKIDKKHHLELYEQYADGGSLTERRKIRPLVIKRIQDIISFATRK